MSQIGAEYGTYSASALKGTLVHDLPYSMTDFNSAAAQITPRYLPATNLRFYNFYQTRRTTQRLVSYGYSGVNQTTYTWNTQSFGTEHATRVLVLVTCLTGGGVVSAVTIGGATPTLVRASSNATGMETRFYSLHAPSGISGTIKFNGSSSPMGASFCLYALYYVNPTAVASGAKGTGFSWPTLALTNKDIVLMTDNNSVNYYASPFGVYADVVNYGNGNGNNPYLASSFRAEYTGNHTVTPGGGSVNGVSWCQYCVFRAA